MTRLWLSWAAWFRTLVDPEFAREVGRLRGALPPPEAAAPPPPLRSGSPAPSPQASSDRACQVLGILQREGRLLDFLEEDVDAFTDAEIGAAARVVHRGCRGAVREHFALQPVRSEAEGSSVRLERGFDATTLRVTGRVVGSPPYQGKLVHRGWRVASVQLPKLTEGHDPMVVAQAEVEL